MISDSARRIKPKAKTAARRARLPQRPEIAVPARETLHAAMTFAPTGPNDWIESRRSAAIDMVVEPGLMLPAAMGGVVR